MRKRPAQQSLHDYFPSGHGGGAAPLEGFSFNPRNNNPSAPSNPSASPPPAKRQRMEEYDQQYNDNPPNGDTEPIDDAPTCPEHDLPCKLMTVRKIGPNTGTNN